MTIEKSAVVLLSGGLDSATVLALARAQGFACYCLSVNYQQRHAAELKAAVKVAQQLEAKQHLTLDLDLSRFGGSALTDKQLTVPEVAGSGIPITYVPARNTIMLSLALAWAEVLDCQTIFVGVNAQDYSGYPDCRPEYISAFQALANLATKSAVEGQLSRIEAPLMHLTKAQIIALGMQHGVDYTWTVSCYQADVEGRACGRCDSCRLRKRGFEMAGMADPTRYATPSS